MDKQRREERDDRDSRLESHVQRRAVVRSVDKNEAADADRRRPGNESGGETKVDWPQFSLSLTCSLPEREGIFDPRRPASCETQRPERCARTGVCV
jgi:hypothetical protein